MSWLRDAGPVRMTPLHISSTGKRSTFRRASAHAGGRRLSARVAAERGGCGGGASAARGSDRQRAHQQRQRQRARQCASSRGRGAVAEAAAAAAAAAARRVQARRVSVLPSLGPTAGGRDGARPGRRGAHRVPGPCIRTSSACARACEQQALCCGSPLGAQDRARQMAGLPWDEELYAAIRASRMLCLARGPRAACPSAHALPAACTSPAPDDATRLRWLRARSC